MTSYGQLREPALELERGCRRLGVRPQDRIVFWNVVDPDAVALLVALFAIGAMPVFVDPSTPTAELDVCLDEIRPDGFIGIHRAHLADAWGPTTFTTPPRPPTARSTMAASAAISQPRPTRIASARPTRPSRGLIATSRRAHRIVGPLDVHQFGVGQVDDVLDEPRGRLGQHHPAGRRRRFHSLGDPDVLPDRGVTQGTGTDLTGDHPT